MKRFINVVICVLVIVITNDGRRLINVYNEITSINLIADLSLLAAFCPCLSILGSNAYATIFCFRCHVLTSQYLKLSGNII